MNTIRQKSENQRTDERHPAWKGDEASYFSKHRWLYARLGRASQCSACGTPNEEVRTEWANISGQYKRDLRDWVALCSSCHKGYDYMKRRGNKCRKGHELIDENTRLVHQSKTGKTYRVCWICKMESRKTPEQKEKSRLRAKKYYQRKRGARLL